MKRPASAMAVITLMPKCPCATKKHEAIHYKKSTVYATARTCKASALEVKPYFGSMRTKSFVVGSGTKPQVVWQKVVKHLKELNP